MVIALCISASRCHFNIIQDKPTDGTRLGRGLIDTETYVSIYVHLKKVNTHACLIKYVDTFPFD